MLTVLSIRDVVLIERLDLSFGAGLTVLTGETGAGKSILLDSLGLALGARADAGLVRAGAEQASVSACFTLAQGQPVASLLAGHGLDAEENLVLRRVVGKDGRSRAFINDQPVSVGLLRRAAALLVEVQGQHEQQGLADPACHAGLLDSFAVPAELRDATAAAWRHWRDITAALTRARSALAEADRDREWLTHAADELSSLAPQPEEEARLAAERHRLQQAERRGEAIMAALAEIAPRDRRNAGPAAALRAAARALARLTPSTSASVETADTLAAPALAAIERAEEALAEAETLLSRLSNEAEADPRLLEAAEERLFALRAAARKYNVAVAALPELRQGFHARLATLETGDAEIAALAREEVASRTAYVEAARTLSTARQQAAARLDRAVNAELRPLRLEKARFSTRLASLDERGWGPSGADDVTFLIATNPGQPPGPLARIASGGELSRLMLALKVVLAGAASVPSLVFDEVDSGIGGATAAAVGERLARVAELVQVLVVTHSPQVAAKGAAHLLVSKQIAENRTSTLVDPLNGADRREEIARMLAGETVTEAARAAADSLLGAA